MNCVTTPSQAASCSEIGVSKVKGNSDAPATPPADPSAPAKTEFELSLEDTLSSTAALSPPGAKGTVGGYNPYDTPIGATEDRNPRKSGVSPNPSASPPICANCPSGFGCSVRSRR